MTTWRPPDPPTGLTASAFTSLSLTPPLVLVCVDHKSHSYPALRDNRRFAVNILGMEQEGLSRRFASTALDKFEGVAYQPGSLGQPLIDGSLAALECETASAYPEGDHTIFVGRVEHATVAAGDPLVYYLGKYRRLQP